MHIPQKNLNILEFQRVWQAYKRNLGNKVTTLTPKNNTLYGAVSDSESDDFLLNLAGIIFPMATSLIIPVNRGVTKKKSIT